METTIIEEFIRNHLILVGYILPFIITEIIGIIVYCCNEEGDSAAGLFFIYAPIPFLNVIPCACLAILSIIGIFLLPMIIINFIKPKKLPDIIEEGFNNANQ